ncbi:MAG TPA: hypothetical protein VF204_05825, partial [Streptosporangiaceae bacterium]
MTAEAIIYVTGLPQMRAFCQECFGLELADSAGRYTPAATRAWAPSHQPGSGRAVSIHQVAPAATYGAARSATADGSSATSVHTT